MEICLDIASCMRPMSTVINNNINNCSPSEVAAGILISLKYVSQFKLVHFNFSEKKEHSECVINQNMHDQV